MQPLTLEETALKEEMKSRCLSKGNYIDENAKARFYMLCHLEDFGLECWELMRKNTKLKKRVKKQKAVINKAIDKLYCYGEALDPVFQKEMLEILSEVLK